MTVLAAGSDNSGGANRRRLLSGGAKVGSGSKVTVRVFEELPLAGISARDGRQGEQPASVMGLR